jgi:hypothetical protein
MFERLENILSRLSGNKAGRTRNGSDDRDESDDRDAGIRVPVRRGPPDRGSSVAVAEPDDED